ncbi:MAG: hypothetical protein AAFO76_09260, partial [Cyanobacteria bacterium J06607_15]
TVCLEINLHASAVYCSAVSSVVSLIGRAIDGGGMKINLKANSKSSGNHTSTRCFTKVNSCSNCQLFLVQVKKVA